MRLWPKSLSGQLLLASGLALLISHAIAGVMIYRASAEQREEAIIGALAFRLIGSIDRPSARQLRSQIRPRLRPAREEPRLRLPVVSEPNSPVRKGEKRTASREKRLDEILRGQGFEFAEAAVTTRRAGDDEVARKRVERRPAMAPPGWANRQIMIAGVREDDGNWRVARISVPRSRDAVPQVILLQLLVSFLVLSAVLYFLLKRITRPLAELTDRVERFGATQSANAQIERSGPEDISRLIGAHNTMENRIVAMLDEKDVMLGAIGHDLKTPLAALRVRIENVEDEAQRGKMAAQIDEIARTLDDILSLARVGRPSDPIEKIELSALLDSITSEYADLGRPVALTQSSRVAVPARATWLGRAIRNLIDNALKYGGEAEAALTVEADQAVITITDAGPGIPEDQLAAMMEPFTRGEPSRNRATGGAGLGLTLARAIAEQHGGSLELTNRSAGGLQAALTLPLR